MIRKILLMLCSTALASAGFIRTDYSPATSVSYSTLSTPTVKTILNPEYEKISNTPIGYTKIVQSPPAYQSVLTTKESNFESPDGTQYSSFTKYLDTDYSSLKKLDSSSRKDGDVIANTVPSFYSTVHSPITYHSGSAYTLSSPVVHTIHSPVVTKSVSAPVSYAPVTKIIGIPSLASYSTSDFGKTGYVTSGLSAYPSNLQGVESQTGLTKSVSGPISYTTQDTSSFKTIASPSLVSYSTSDIDKSRYVTSGLSSYSSNSPDVQSQPIKTTVTFSEAPLVSHMTFTGLGTSYTW